MPEPNREDVQARIDQGLGSNNTARTTTAVDHDFGIGLSQGQYPVNQFGARAERRAGNAIALMFRVGA